MPENTSDELVISVAVIGLILVLTLVCALITGVVLYAVAGTGTPVTPAADQPATEAVEQAEATPVVTLRDAGVEPGRYQWQPVYEGFNSPLFVTHAGDGSGRIFVVEQAGAILVLQDGALLPEPFLDVFDHLSQNVHQGRYTEQGLLGLAFHPDFAENGQFFIHHTDLYGDNVIARYTVSADDSNRADPASRTVLLTIDQPFPDHNGGSIAFGNDGFLYAGIGDGGNPNDPNNNSQDGATLLGKILRIDVNAETYAVPLDNPFFDTPGYLPEIWAMGVRNPWRFSFDRATGDLYIGDVGQWAIEEVSFEPSDHPGGANYGWSAWEGSQRYREEIAVDAADATMPFFEYEHSAGCSVTGGYVYRGAALPELHGVYFAGDYCSGAVWSAYRDRAGRWRTDPFMQTGFTISSFGEDEAGELYLIDYKGAIYRLGLVE